MEKFEKYVQLLCNRAKELNTKIQQFKIQKTYISKQTGISLKELNNILSLKDEGIIIKSKSEFQQINDIMDKIQSFLEIEYHDFIEGFNQIYHNHLCNEFKIKHKLEEKMIKNKLNNNSLELYLSQYGHFSNYKYYSYTLEEIEAEQSMQEDLKETTSYLDFIEYQIDNNGESKENTHIYENLQQKISYLHENLKYFEDLNKKAIELANITYPYDLSYDINLRIENSLKNIERHKLASSNFVFKSDQQQAIFEIYFDECRDKNGYLLPNHFGTGIHLLEYIHEKVYFPRFKKNKNFQSKYKVKPWATEENLKLFNWEASLPTTDTNDIVYQFILNHKNIFLKDILVKDTLQIVQKIKSIPNFEVSQLIEFLKNDLDTFIPKTSKQREHYKSLAEYYDILSYEFPITDISLYSKERIYRIIYEMVETSNGRYSFSYELVNQAYIYLKYSAKYWRLQLYIYNFRFKYKSIEPILQFIQKKSIEYNGI